MTKKDQNGSALREPGNSDETIEAIRAAGPAYEGSTDVDVAQAVEDALADQSAPVFNTHSTALAGKMMAEAEGYRSMIADIDAKIEALNAERTDVMLAYSMLSKGIEAKENGSK
jgi:hypothetical protein